MTLTKLNLRDLFWLVVVVALAVSLVIAQRDRQRLHSKLKEANEMQTAMTAALHRVYGPVNFYLTPSPGKPNERVLAYGTSEPLSDDE
jgi:hypothetical protein